VFCHRIGQFTLDARLPAILESREMVAAGGLMSYGSSYVELTRRAGVFIDKLLRGANPADLPFEQATKFELVINKKTARHLGISFRRQSCY
jgi:putative ABC transport system substrate-binding protein